MTAWFTTSNRMQQQFDWCLQSTPHSPARTYTPLHSPLNRQYFKYLLDEQKKKDDWKDWKINIYTAIIGISTE